MARTGDRWKISNTGTYIETVGSPSGYDLLINGSNHYINFNSLTGESGYGIRDNAGTMEFKDSGGVWAAFGTGGGGGTLADVSTASDDNTKSIYSMTENVDVHLRWFSGNAGLYFDESAENIGVGTVSPLAKFHIESTTEQNRLSYNTTNYFSTTVASTGATTFAITSDNGTPVFNFNRSLTVVEARTAGFFNYFQNTTASSYTAVSVGSNAGATRLTLYSFGTTYSSSGQYQASQSLLEAEGDMYYSAGSKHVFYGNVGIGTGTASLSAKLNILSTTEQIRSAYDASNYWNATTDSTGITTFNAVGSGASFVFSDKVGFNGRTPTAGSWEAPLGDYVGWYGVNGIPSTAYIRMRGYLTGNNPEFAINCFSGGVTDFTYTFNSTGVTAPGFFAGTSWLGNGFLTTTILNLNTSVGTTALYVSYLRSGISALGATGFAGSDGTYQIRLGGNADMTSGTQIFAGSTSGIGIFTASASAALHVTKTTEQFRSAYDASNYWNATTGSSGITTFDAVGSAAAFVFSDDVQITTAGTNSTSVVTNAGTQTLTNKRITQRVVTTTDDATAVIDVAVTDVYELSAIANNTTFSFTGTPTDGQKFVVRYKDAGVSKTLTWTGFVAIGITLPAATTAGKWGYVGVIYNSAASAYHAVSVTTEA